MSRDKHKKKRAIVLSGGGARGAYQVGVLKALCEIADQERLPTDISIFTGISAGAINAGYMAAHAHDFHLGVKRLIELWGNLTSDQVFSSDVAHMGKIAFKWMTELPFGAVTGTTPGRSLLDTSPLEKLIKDNLPFEQIQKNIDNGSLYAVAMTATDYGTSNSITFVQGHAEAPSWTKTRRMSKKTVLNHSHVMASSAIPLLFPPVAVGQRYFGDGCVRNSSPCAPSIYLGAEKLLVIGVRMKTLSGSDKRAAVHTEAPSVALVVNVLLNAVLLDGIEMDIERLERMNAFVGQVPQKFQEGLSYRAVDADLVSPSQDIGDLALKHSNEMPRLIRYLLKGLGTLDDASETISYLLFSPDFCQKLIAMGYEDGLRDRDKIKAFLG
jgi:NTE family protein